MKVELPSQHGKKVESMIYADTFPQLRENAEHLGELLAGGEPFYVKPIGDLNLQWSGTPKVHTLSQTWKIVFDVDPLEVAQRELDAQGE